MAKRKILVVEDEPAITKVVRKRLELGGYDVVTAADGAEGIAKTLRERPDLIISDIMMPTMDGYTFIKQLRAEPSVAHTPVIVLTAKPKMQDLFFFQGVQTVDYIVKPFDADDVLQKIAQLLARVESHLRRPGSPGRPATPPSPPPA